MILSGDEILQAALETVTSGRDHSEDDLNLVSRRSGFVLDTLNIRNETTVGGVVKVGVLLKRGQTSFTFGPGGDISRPAPTGVRTWGYVDGGGTEINMTPATLLTAEQWASAQQDQDQDDPRWLYWDKVLSGGLYTFHVLPAGARDVQIYLYAFIPKLDRVNRGTQAGYELEPGMAQFFINKLAIDVAPLFGLDVPPSVRSAARSAANNSDRFQSENTPLNVVNNSFLLGLGIRP